MQKIKVARKEQKETAKGNTMVAVFDEKNVRFSGFLPELKDIMEGDTIEAEIEVDGKYNNIKSVKILSHGEAPEKPASKSYGQDSPEKRRSIERQTALTQAVEYLKDIGEADSHFVLKTAEVFYQWISEGRISAPPSTKETSKPVASKAEPATDSPDKPLTATAVYNLIADAIKGELITKEVAEQKIVELGGDGKDNWSKVRSLKPDKLVELKEWIGGTGSEKEKELFE